MLVSLRCLPFLAVAGVNGGRANYRHVCEADNDEESKEGPVDPSKSHDAGNYATSLCAPAAQANVCEFVREDRRADKVQHPDDDIEEVLNGIRGCNSARLNTKE